MTERFPGELSSLQITPGQACTISIGGDLVITGYADRFVPRLSGREHSITVQGRGKCADLVLCTVDTEQLGCQISGVSALLIAQQLAATYGISVTGEEATDTIPQLNVAVTETVWDVIEQACRYQAMLAYEDVDGNLIIGRAGSGSMASGVSEGINVQSASVIYSQDQRYSEYRGYRMGIDMLSDAGQAGNLVATAKDQGVTRTRIRGLVVESPGEGDGFSWSQKRVNWECARRAGRGGQAVVTVDSWRDESGALWQPNAIVPVDLPTLKLTGVRWGIASATYTLDERGTRTDLLLMDPKAFDPAPILPPGPWELAFAGTYF
jgi:prophage tail gpP-like protein